MFLTAEFTNWYKNWQERLETQEKSLDKAYELMKNSDSVDVRGDVYEYLLNKIAQSGLNGQFRTPRHIIRMMVDMVEPKADDVICDPACGTSGFLVSAGEYLKENRKEEIFFDRQKKDHYMNSMFFGYDMDRTMLRIGAMNMMTHGIENPYIEYKDSLSDQNMDKDKYSLILANPPFKGSIDAERTSKDVLASTKNAYPMIRELIDNQEDKFMKNKIPGLTDIEEALVNVADKYSCFASFKGLT